MSNVEGVAVNDGVLEELVEDAEKVLKSEVTGEGWAHLAVGPLSGIAVAKKHLEGEKKESVKWLKVEMEKKEKPYKDALKGLEWVDGELRKRVLVEIEGKGCVREDGVGELVFSEYDDFKVTDLGKVDRRYLCLDHKKVMEDIKGGVTNIKGIKVGKKRVLSVRPVRSSKEE